MEREEQTKKKRKRIEQPGENEEEDEVKKKMRSSAAALEVAFDSQVSLLTHPKEVKGKGAESLDEIDPPSYQIREPKISKIEVDIEDVKKKIKKIEKKLKKGGLSEADTNYYRQKEHDLRQEMNHLRQEKNILLSMLPPQEQPVVVNLVSEEASIFIKDYSTFYREYKPKIDAPLSTLLKNMQACTEENLVTLDDSDVIALNCGVQIEPGIASNVLFIRSFYNDLLDNMRKKAQRGVHLIGNSGIGKSMFQYYIIARLMNPDVLSPLKEDYYGSVDPYKVIIRHVMKPLEVQIMFSTGEALKVQSIDLGLFDCFDVRSTLYLYEPGDDKYQEPVIPKGHESPFCISTMSPNPNRYKETKKISGVKTRYFPSWEAKRDLLAIARYVRSEFNLTDEEKSSLADADVNSRISEFGFLIRPIFKDGEDISDYRKDRDDFLGELKIEDMRQILTGSIKDKTKGHYVVQLRGIPIEGGKAFKDYGLDICSDYVYKQLEDTIQKADLSDRIHTLRRNMQTPMFYPELCGKLYERVVVDLIMQRQCNDWMISKVEFKKENKSIKASEGTSVVFIKNFEKVEEGQFRKFKDMEKGVMYVSLNPIEKAVEMVSKVDNKRMVLYRIKWQKEPRVEINGRLLIEVIEKCSVPHDVTVEYNLFPKPDSTEKKTYSECYIDMKEANVFLASKKHEWEWNILQVKLNSI